MTGPPITSEQIARAQQVRDGGGSWKAAGEAVGANPRRLRYAMDEDFRKKHQESAKKYNDKKRGAPRQRRPRKPREPGVATASTPGSPLRPVSSRDRRARARGLAGTSLAESIEAGVRRRLEDAA